MIALSHPALHRHSQMNAKVTCLSRNTPTEPLYSHHRHHDLSITIRGKGKKKKKIIIKRKEKRKNGKQVTLSPFYLFFVFLPFFLSFTLSLQTKSFKIILFYTMSILFYFN